MAVPLLRRRWPWSLGASPPSAMLTARPWTNGLAMGSRRSTIIGIAGAIGVCVCLQLLLTITLPQQTWSMPLGLAMLCFICAAAAVVIGARHGRRYRFETITIAAVFAVWGLMWLTWIYEIGWRGGDQSLSSALSFTHQILMILMLVPRGERDGAQAPLVLDVVLGVALCALVSSTTWPHIFAGPTDRPPHYMTFLMYTAFSGLGIVSWIVQRRAPPLFLKAFVVTQCVYSLTSVLSVELAMAFMIPGNSPIWLYGDIAMILFPFVAIGSEQSHPVPPPEKLPTPNQIVPFMIAILVLGLAFGSAHRQQTLAGLIGIAGLLAYSFRFAYVTRQYRGAQKALVAAGRLRVEALMDVVHELRSPLASGYAGAGHRNAGAVLSVASKIRRW